VVNQPPRTWPPTSPTVPPTTAAATP
jgi:hypothetical protein